MFFRNGILSLADFNFSLFRKRIVSFTSHALRKISSLAVKEFFQVIYIVIEEDGNVLNRIVIEFLIINLLETLLDFFFSGGWRKTTMQSITNKETRENSNNHAAN